MADPNYSFATSGDFTGIKTFTVLVPTGDCVKQNVPAILTPLKSCPNYVQKHGQSLYGEYVFVGCEPSGRTNASYTAFNFAFVDAVAVGEKYRVAGFVGFHPDCKC